MKLRNAYNDYLFWFGGKTLKLKHINHYSLNTTLMENKLNTRFPIKKSFAARRKK